MATTRIMPLHAGKGRTVGKAISDIIGYVKNPEKTDHDRLIAVTNVTAAWPTRSSCWTSRPIHLCVRLSGNLFILLFCCGAAQFWKFYVSGYCHAGDNPVKCGS